MVISQALFFPPISIKARTRFPLSCDVGISLSSPWKVLPANCVIWEITLEIEEKVFIIFGDD